MGPPPLSLLASSPGTLGVTGPSVHALRWSAQASWVSGAHNFARVLSLFTIVSFQNTACNTAAGINGTCLHAAECAARGGRAGGTCAKGYGVCCLFVRTCGERSNANNTFFVNSRFPGANMDVGSCTFLVDKINPRVSQLRLDFDTFELAAPTNGTCVENQFIVTGQNINSIVPVLCGINTGQHVYVDVDEKRGPFKLSVVSTGGMFPRTFRIRVTQLKKGPSLAPKHCLQYYTDTMGTIEMFNYNSMGNTLGVMPSYLNNLNYVICIKKNPGYCSITYTNVDRNGVEYPFKLLNVDADGQSVIPRNQAGADVFNCPDDYIIISGIRLCGEKLNDATVDIDFRNNAPVTDETNGPFLVYVHTDNSVTDRGFKLLYMQNLCMSTYQ
ncbi:uncharacterized protein LOC134528890 [Bacillus rossius redtenbacheri]|uniref:uncharacterized protein LOC134528890 n=1 Tax=Bacillus rossius redtenbacheri TaxID=93214 RepID=UPI002FDDABC3